MLTAFYERQIPSTGHREAPAGLCLVEAGIEPTSLKDRPEIFWAQSMLSLLLGFCTHTDMVQTNSIVEIIPPGSKSEVSASILGTYRFPRIVNKLALDPLPASPGTTVPKTLHYRSAITALTPTELIRISPLSLAPPQHDPYQRQRQPRTL